jgi:hypothetical protein
LKKDTELNVHNIARYMMETSKKLEKNVVTIKKQQSQFPPAA